MSGLLPSQNSLSTTHSPDDGNQHHGAEHRNEQAIQIKTGHTALAKKGHDEATKNRANDTDNDIHERALLCIGLHDQRRNPARDRTKDNPEDNTHKIVVRTYAKGESSEG